eukprot:2902888-Rhodomonas_salina.1
MQRSDPSGGRGIFWLERGCACESNALFTTPVAFSPSPARPLPPLLHALPRPSCRSRLLLRRLAHRCRLAPPSPLSTPPSLCAVLRCSLGSR